MQKDARDLGWKQNGHGTASEHNLINKNKNNKNVSNKSFTLLSIDLVIENDVYVFKDN